MTDEQPYRLLVTGWRAWPVDLAWFIGLKIARAVIALDFPLRSRLVVMQGECPYGGADLWAKRFCEREGITCEGYPAEVMPNGRILGPQRNQRMVDLRPYACLAFPGPGGGGGTRDCYMKALSAGIPAQIWPIEYVRSLGR